MTTAGWELLLACLLRKDFWALLRWKSLPHHTDTALPALPALPVA